MSRSRKHDGYHLPVLIEQDEDGIVIVLVPALKACRKCGHTMDEALKNIAETASLCLENEKPNPRVSFAGVRDLEIVA